MARPSKDSRTRRKHRSHRSSESRSDLLPDRRDDPPRRPSNPPSSRHNRVSRSYSSQKTGQTLSVDSLAKLNALNQKLGWDKYDNIRQSQGFEREKAEVDTQVEERERPIRIEKRDKRRKKDHNDHNHYREKRKISGPELEEGRRERPRHRKPKHRGGGRDDHADPYKRKRRRNFCILGFVVLIILIIIVAAVEVSKNKSNSSSSVSDNPDSSTPKPSNGNLGSISKSSIPPSAQGTYYDPFTWYDTTDFNVTYTNVTIGGLPIMGLNSTWDDNTQANPNVPILSEKFNYGTMKIRGINLGGWLSIEPFITPSLFDGFSTSDGVVDEWTLTSHLGPTIAAQTLEQHYSAWISEETFAEIQAAGFDHVRIPFSYWAVTTYDGDPYVPMISWRYLLRGIEWARKYGLRINLDLHGIPGSQNGWNHSGRQGVIGWLNGTDGQLNAQRSLDIHRQLSTFFAQKRYINIISMYGLVNEPRMVELDTADVLTWTQSAINIVRTSGMWSEVIIVIGDGFLGLANWQGKLTSDPNLLLDAHQYVIFNNQQLALNHSAKLDFACQGWSQQTLQSMDPSTGFGSFLCGEWSQADTDCTTYLNDVGIGSRWEGTMNLPPELGIAVLNPTCPTNNNPQCTCDPANADPSSYSSAYKEWLQMFAEAQITSYEKGWGWFYWTWDTETATQWSWKKGAAAGILPAKAYAPVFSCNTAIPDFASMGLSEAY